MTPVFPPVPMRLTPSSVVMLAQNIAPASPPDTSSSTNPQVLVVIVSGDVDISGYLIQVSVSGGFSSDGGQSLDDVEPTMFFRHDDFVIVHSNHPRPFHHPLDPTNDESSLERND